MTLSTQLRRPTTRLTPAPAVPVRFSGLRGADGPMTLGQLNIRQWLSGAPEHLYATLGAELPIPDGVRIADVVATVAVLLARHEGLRTRYRDGGQHVLDSGELTITRYSVDVSAGRTGVAQALARRLRAEPRDPAGLPFRVAVATADDVVVAAAMDLSHVAVDHQGLEVVRQEFAAMVANPAARRPGAARHQPLHQAELENSPRQRQQADAALDYWHARLTTMPQCLYATSRVGSTGESLCARLSSAAAALAVRRIAARTRTSRSSVVLAAIGAVLAQRTGYRELVFPALSSNRFEPRLAHYVGTLAQGCVTRLAVAGLGFDQLVRQSWLAVIEACRYGRYDAYRRVEMAERIEYERGVSFDYEPLFNSMLVEAGSPAPAPAPSAGQLLAARRATELSWRPMPASRTPIRFDLHEADEILRLDLWTGDTGRIGRDELGALLTAVEDVLIAAAGGGLTATQVQEAVRLQPIPRGPGWLLVDSCWVELAEVQRLVDRALAPSVARIFAEADGRPLVAYVAAGESVRDPEQAHARCMAALPGHLTALAPRHYVVCATAPADPDNRADWPAPLCAGSGRSSRDS